MDYEETQGNAQAHALVASQVVERKPSPPLGQIKAIVELIDAILGGMRFGEWSQVGDKLSALKRSLEIPK